LALLVPKVPRAMSVLREPTANPARLVLKVSKATLVLRVHKDSKAMSVLWDRKVPLVRWELPA
jgi:hypothetical protein